MTAHFVGIQLDNQDFTEALKALVGTMHLWEMQGKQAEVNKCWLYLGLFCELAS